MTDSERKAALIDRFDAIPSVDTSDIDVQVEDGCDHPEMQDFSFLPCDEVLARAGQSGRAAMDKDPMRQ